ncbi:hypothetical protein HYALB_00008304 [Hymenoscyphus albidus]|uniref:Uncharacterized protein n=1 Tax=Hymenoscyphus albidus TaxID=595503 RepID=A0A9N9LB75_9HELO|nr:hypothetical protein HYALB_00008304 [Hymenoscyphus albidus]
MLIFTSSVVAALLGSVACFVVPTNLPDGFYTVYEGSDIPIRQPDIELQATGARDVSNHPRNLFKRLVDPLTHCDNYAFNGDNYSTALRNMNSWCNDQGGALAGNTLKFFVSGTAVAYVCNYTDGRNTCFHEFEQANDIMDVVCGRGRPVSVHVAAYAKTLGRANTGVDICFAGTHAKTIE